MSPINSRNKGRKAEVALAKILMPYWPEACRNLDQFGPDKRDQLNVADLHFQCKHVEKLNIWTALDQAIMEARAGDLPIVVFKRNWDRSALPSRSKWFASLELDELLPLLKLREA